MNGATAIFSLASTCYYRIFDLAVLSGQINAWSINVTMGKNTWRLSRCDSICKVIDSRKREEIRSEAYEVKWWCFREENIKALGHRVSRHSHATADQNAYYWVSRYSLVNLNLPQFNNFGKRFLVIFFQIGFTWWMCLSSECLLCSNFALHLFISCSENIGHVSLAYWVQTWLLRTMYIGCDLLYAFTSTIIFIALRLDRNSDIDMSLDKLVLEHRFAILVDHSIQDIYNKDWDREAQWSYELQALADLHDWSFGIEWSRSSDRWAKLCHVRC